MNLQEGEKEMLKDKQTKNVEGQVKGCDGCFIRWMDPNNNQKIVIQ